jgi:hypothetical protein
MAIRSKFVAMLLGAVLSVGTAAAQQQQAGLVNVAVGDIKTGDIASNNKVVVDVAANVAATVCGTTVNAAVISEQLAKTGAFKCEGPTQFVRITQAQ